MCCVNGSKAQIDADSVFLRHLRVIVFTQHISKRSLLGLLSLLDAGRRLCLLLRVSVQHLLVSLQKL